MFFARYSFVMVGIHDHGVRATQKFFEQALQQERIAGRVLIPGNGLPGTP